MSWKSSSKFEFLLKHLLDGFVTQFECHMIGSERFARFLIGWHNFVGTIACSVLQTESSDSLWKDLTGTHNCSEEDRSGIVFGVASCFYTFVQQQVSSIIIITKHSPFDT